MNEVYPNPISTYFSDGQFRDYFNDETGKRVRVDPRAMTFEEFDL